MPRDHTTGPNGISDIRECTRSAPRIGADDDHVGSHSGGETSTPIDRAESDRRIRCQRRQHLPPTETGSLHQLILPKRTVVRVEADIRAKKNVSTSTRVVSNLIEHDASPV